MSRQTPSDWQLQGVDISNQNYPASEFLPKNITLKVMDIFADTHEDMVGKFDVVHVRALAVVIKHSDPGPLLRKLVSMLSQF